MRTFILLFSSFVLLSSLFAPPKIGRIFFFDTYRVGECLSIVLEKPIGHGIAYLRVFPSGLRPQIGAIAGGAGAQDIPNLFVRMLGLVHDIAVESRHEGNLACVVDGRNAIF